MNHRCYLKEFTLGHESERYQKSHFDIMYPKRFPIRGVSVPDGPLFQAREEWEMVAGNFVYHKTRKTVHNTILCITGETQNHVVSHAGTIVVHSGS